MVAQLLFYKIMQLFCMMILGFVLTKVKLLKSEDSTVLSKLTLYIFTPAVVLGAFNIEKTAAVMQGLSMALVVALVIHAVLILLDLGLKKVLKTTNVERASIIFSNAGNLIVPLVSYILGDEWVIYSSAYMMVTIVSCWTYGVKLFSDDKASYKKILLNVNVIATLIGAFMLLCGIRLPKFAGEITSSLGSMIGPVSMIIAGMLAAKVDFGKMLKNKRLYLVSIMRLLVFPLMIMVLLKGVKPFVGIPNADTIMLITFLAVISPSASTVLLFAQLYGKDARYATAINVITTIGCVITMPLLIMLF